MRAHLKIEFLAGTDIDSACCEAVRIANMLRVTIDFDFNGVKVHEPRELQEVVERHGPLPATRVVPPMPCLMAAGYAGRPGTASGVGSALGAAFTVPAPSVPLLLVLPGCSGTFS